MDLKSLVDHESVTTKWFEFEDGFDIELAYVPRPKIEAIMRKATKTRTGPRGVPTERLDNDIARRELVELCVRNWKVSKDALLRLVRLKSEPQGAFELECTTDNAFVLVCASGDLESFIVNMATDLRNFRSGAEKETKNS